MDLESIGTSSEQSEANGAFSSRTGSLAQSDKVESKDYYGGKSESNETSEAENAGASTTANHHAASNFSSLAASRTIIGSSRRGSRVEGSNDCSSISAAGGSSVVKEYLERRHQQTSNKISKLRSAKIRSEVDACSGKPQISKNS